jgi:diguanylate cyclase (GGDEF)-like protein
MLSRTITQFARPVWSFAIEHRVAILEIIFLASTVLGGGFLALEYDVFRDAPQKEKRLELTELLSIGGVLLSGLCTFAWYRARGYRNELRRRIAAEERAHASARHDALTGLPNRRRFTERAGEALGRAWSQGSQCAVLFIDLDGFKPVNDMHGHAVGDALLVEIADRLRFSAPDPANVARLGGDEFAALIEYSDGNDIPALSAKRILREIQRPIIIDGKRIAVSATVGMAIGPESGRRAEDLIHAADLAMYEGKRAGRGIVRMFEAA